MIIPAYLEQGMQMPIQIQMTLFADYDYFQNNLIFSAKKDDEPNQNTVVFTSDLKNTMEQP